MVYEDGRLVRSNRWCSSTWCIPPCFPQLLECFLRLVSARGWWPHPRSPCQLRKTSPDRTPLCYCPCRERIISINTVSHKTIIHSSISIKDKSIVNNFIYFSNKPVESAGGPPRARLCLRFFPLKRGVFPCCCRQVLRGEYWVSLNQTVSSRPDLCEKRLDITSVVVWLYNKNWNWSSRVIVYW